MLLIIFFDNRNKQFRGNLTDVYTKTKTLSPTFTTPPGLFWLGVVSVYSVASGTLYI